MTITSVVSLLVLGDGRATGNPAISTQARLAES